MLHLVNLFATFLYDNPIEKYDIKPAFNSELTTTLFQMESVSNKFISGDTPLWPFYDLKDTLQLLESLNIPKGILRGFVDDKNSHVLYYYDFDNSMIASSSPRAFNTIRGS